MRDLNLVEVWGGAYVNLLLGSLKIHQKKVSIDQINYITGCSMLIRLSAIIDVGYFDEKYFMYWEDTDISFSFQKKGWKLAVADDSKVWHQGSASLGGEGSLSKQIYTLQSAVIFFSKFSKYPRLTVFLYFLMKSIGGVIKRKDLYENNSTYGGKRFSFKTT